MLQYSDSTKRQVKKIKSCAMKKYQKFTCFSSSCLMNCLFHQPNTIQNHVQCDSRNQNDRLRTFLLEPFPLSLPFAVSFSVGFWDMVKNPSSRPCCFAFRNLVSFSAPLRTRSSLIFGVSTDLYQKFKNNNVLETFLDNQELYKTIYIWGLPVQLYIAMMSLCASKDDR